MKKTCINTSDVIKVTNVSPRQAQSLLRAIRLAYKKEKHQFVTVAEFSAYTGIDGDTLRDGLDS